jgi:hypothetical protein
MRKSIQRFCFLLALIIPFFVNAAIQVGLGKMEMTPPIGTPSAGYSARKGEGMEGMHDPLYAIALLIDCNLRPKRIA